MSNKIFLAWQDQTTRRWRTIGVLTKISDGYEFVFTKGASFLGSLPSTLFRMEPGYCYHSAGLMPLFSNKIPSRTRPDFLKMAHWVGLKGDEDEFSLLERFGLITGVDGLLAYAEPAIKNNRYTVDFFAHGLRHVPNAAIELRDSLREGDTLLPLLDVKNPADPNAIALRGDKDTLIVGWAPAFYAADLYRILRIKDAAQSAEIKVLRNSMDAPLQVRLLCQFTAEVEPNFHALDTEEHQLWLVESAKVVPC